MLNKVKTIAKLMAKNYSEFSLRKFGKQYVLKTGNKYIDKKEIVTHIDNKVFENEYQLLNYMERRI